MTKFPAVSRDIALLVKETVTNQEFTEVIHSAAGRFLTDIQLFDVYQGENIEKGHKSMAYSLTFDPTTAKSYDIPETYVAEFDLSAVVEAAQKGIVFEAVTKFPSVSREIALLVNETATNQ